MDRTAGDYTTEPDAERHVDSLLSTTDGLFKVHKQVEGSFWSVRRSHKNVVIDRVLWPTRRLIDLGWKCGVVGIEVKKSNHRVGDLVNQACDYVESSIFRIPVSGVTFSLNSVFVFPGFEYTDTLASVMAAHRIGVLRERHGRLMLQLNHSRLLDYWPESGWRIGTSPNTQCGMKVGSR